MYNGVRSATDTLKKDGQVMSENKQVTIKDIAKRAGVAVSTVSRVLNKLDRVSPKTRNKVMQAVNELGYVQNKFAVFLVTGHTKLILIVVPDFINSFFGAVIQGAEHRLRVDGYSTMVTSTGDYEDTEVAEILQKMQYSIDGAIVIPTGDRAEQYAQFQKPLVFVDRTVSGTMSDVVCVDNYRGCYELTNELISAGHRKIAYIGGGDRLNIGRDRFSGFLDAMHEQDVPVRDCYVRRGDLYVTDGYCHMSELLRRPDPPTAVICGNNLICSGAVAAIRELDLELGRDISLVSFDDQPLASLARPGITVIDRPTTKMGELAAELLIRQLHSGRPDGQQKIVMPVKLIRRDSVRRISAEEGVG